METHALEVSFNKVAGLILASYYKETPAQVFSCEFWMFFKNNFLTEHLLESASESTQFLLLPQIYKKQNEKRKNKEKKGY